MLDFCTELFYYVISNNHQLAKRQLAAVTLKNSVDQVITLDPTQKENLKKQLVSHLNEPNSAIRSNIALTVSKIAHLEWPEHWPNLFMDLVELLKGDLHACHGALSVLTNFVRDDLSDQAFPQVAPVLLPELYKIFTGNYPSNLRGKAVAICKDFVEMIYMVKEEHPDSVSNYLVPFISVWTDTFIQILKESDDVIVKNQVLLIVVKLVRAFPKQMANYIMIFMEIIWNEATSLKNSYLQNYINDNNELAEEVDSDGETHSISTILYSCFDYIQQVCRKKAVKPLFEKSLKDIFRVLLVYLQITNETEANWMRDMSQFVQDDDEEAAVYNVRIAVEQCLINLIDAFKVKGVTALFEVCSENFIISKEQRQAGSKYWWKLNEASLFALGRFPSELIGNAHSLNMDYIFTDIVVADMNCTDLPFLQGRALWFSSQFASDLPENLTNQYLAACVDALVLTHINFAVKVFAMKSIRGFLSSGRKLVGVVHQANVIKGLVSLAPHLKDDLLILLLETLTLAIGINKEITAQHEEMLTGIFIKLLDECCEDLFITELLHELFTELSANEQMSISFQTKMFPILSNAIDMEQVHKNATISATALDLLTELIKNVPDPLPTAYTIDIFPKVIQMMLTVEDSALLQNGQDTLKVLVNRDFNGIVQWNNGNRNGLEYLLEFIGKMLGPNESESSALFIGNLIVKLIQKGGDLIVPYIPTILAAVIHRLEQAKIPAFIETLVLIFCHLIQTRAETVIEFLASLSINSCSGLEIFVRHWCECFNDISGVYENKLSVNAMLILFASGDPRLEMVTRSRAKANPEQYSTLTFPQKAIGLLLGEYKSLSQPKIQPNSLKDDHVFEFDGESEDDWEGSDNEDPDPFAYYQEDDNRSEDSEQRDDPVFSVNIIDKIEGLIKGCWSNGMQDLFTHLAKPEQTLVTITGGNTVPNAGDHKVKSCRYTITGDVDVSADISWRYLYGKVLPGFVLKSVQLDLLLNQEPGSSEDEKDAACYCRRCNMEFKKDSEMAKHSEWHRSKVFKKPALNIFNCVIITF
ncbi:Importin 9 [Boothiomyces sp. JEL0866]|nr:Importin 9 [Boothiomyces sp. JEL0866]